MEIAELILTQGPKCNKGISQTMARCPRKSLNLIKGSNLKGLKPRRPSSSISTVVGGSGDGVGLPPASFPHQSPSSVWQVTRLGGTLMPSSPSDARSSPPQDRRLWWDEELNAIDVSWYHTMSPQTQGGGGICFDGEREQIQKQKRNQITWLGVIKCFSWDIKNKTINWNSLKSLRCDIQMWDHLDLRPIKANQVILQVNSGFITSNSLVWKSWLTRFPNSFCSRTLLTTGEPWKDPLSETSREEMWFCQVLGANCQLSTIKSQDHKIRLKVKNPLFLSACCVCGGFYSRLRDFTAQCCFCPSGSMSVPWKTQPKWPAGYNTSN